MRLMFLTAALLVAGIVSIAAAGTYVRGYTRRDGTYVSPHWRRGGPTGGSYGIPESARPERDESRPTYSPSTRSWSLPQGTLRLMDPPRSRPSDEAQGVSRDKHGRIQRSESAKDAFKREHPCPSTGRTEGSCPGYVIDHIVPLKRGGPDAPVNMQWQTVEQAKAKDRWE